MKNCIFKQLIIASSFLFMSGPFALADTLPTNIYGNDSLGAVRYVRVVTDDQVKDGCWTNIRSVEAKVRLILEQSDIATLSENQAYPSPVAPVLYVSAFGFRSGNLCVVHTSLEAVYSSYSSLGDSNQGATFKFVNPATNFSSSAMYTNSNNVNAQVLDFYETSTSEYAASVLSARRNEDVRHFFELNPFFYGEPISESELQDLLSKSDV